MQQNSRSSDLQSGTEKSLMVIAHKKIDNLWLLTTCNVIYRMLHIEAHAQELYKAMNHCIGVPGFPLRPHELPIPEEHFFKGSKLL